MWSVILTGGMGSGKSTVAKMFEELGAIFFNADAVVRELLLEDGVHQRLVERWGNDIVDQDPLTIRRCLRVKLLSSVTDRQWLEELLHPLVVQRLAEFQQKENVAGRYLLAEIPLYFQMKKPPRADRLLVVECPVKVRVERLRSYRPDLTELQIRQFVSLQSTKRADTARVDDVIDNNCSLAELRQQVLALHLRYLSLVN